MTNIVYLHCHDAGRYISPMGFALETQNLQRLAREGVLFRQAFCAAPTCSASRSALLTGQCPHNNGMNGLAHLGWQLNDYGEHVVHDLRAAGYQTVLSGVQHVASREGWNGPSVIGYDRNLEGIGDEADAGLTNMARRDREQARAAARWLTSPDARSAPFFLSVGFLLPHRVFAPADAANHELEDSRYVRPPAPLPDTAETRADFADYAASVRSMDACCGVVLQALEEAGLAQNTLVVATTDHGPAFPGMKANLNQHGMGVYLILRGPGGCDGGKVSDALVSHLDVYPTLCEMAGIEAPQRLQGASLLPLVRGEVEEIHDEIHGEVTYHAAYQPMRSVRTKRWNLVRRFDPEWRRPVLTNCDDGASKQLWHANDWGRQDLPEFELYDLLFDPCERHNLADDARHADVFNDLRRRLDRWMVETHDPLLSGPVALPPHGRMATVDGVDVKVKGRTKFRSTA